MTIRREDDRTLILQMIQQNDDKHEDAHTRMRADQRALEAEMRALTQKTAALELTVTQSLLTLKAATEGPVDVGKIMFNPKMVLGIVGLVASIVTGNWLTNQPIREQLVRQEERWQAVQTSVDDLKRQMEMRRLEIQAVSNDLQQIKRTK